MNIVQEITFPPELIEAISDRVVEKLLYRLYEEDELLNIEQASTLLRVSKNQIYQWVFNTSHGAGDFPSMKAGKALRFSKKKLLKWLERR